ncbi:MAG: TonB-dependent receptor plug domain-containing protein, partial [Bacteroidota bacterium]
MKQVVCFYLLFCSLFFYSNLSAQQKFTISGYVEDQESGEKLLAVNLFDVKSKSGAVTNTYGFYSLTLPKDSVVLAVSYVGYQTKYMRIYLDKDIKLNIALSAAVELETVEVVAAELETIEQRTEMSTMEVPVEQIKKIPALLGEVDVFKALQLLPGVQSGGEGQSGLYVRGGSPDQNLILLDGVPVYNASHLFGFFSVFNADAIKDVKLTKGGFPARYGGRLSSVIEIGMKEGDMNEWHSTGTVGIVASKFTFEGPIKKGKTSMIFSGRRTYIDLLTRPLIRAAFRSEGSDGNAGYFFHDFNTKINHKFSDKDRLYFSVYTGRDKFFFREEDKEDQDIYKSDFGLGWGNITSALRWNHVWNNKLFSNTTVTYSRYQFDTRAAEEDIFVEGGERERDKVGIDYSSGINDWAGRIDFDYFPNPNHYIRFGANIIHHTFNPGAFDLEIRSESPGDNFVL